MFGVHLHLPKYGHKISVTCPARHYVAMDVFIVARTRCFADIISGIESIGFNDSSQNVNAFMDQLSDFYFFSIILFRYTAYMSIG